MGIRRSKPADVTPLRPIQAHQDTAYQATDKPRKHTREELICIRMGRREGLLLGLIPGFILGMAVAVSALFVIYRDGIVHGQALGAAVEQQYQAVRDLNGGP